MAFYTGWISYRGATHMFRCCVRWSHIWRISSRMPTKELVSAEGPPTCFLVSSHGFLYKEYGHGWLSLPRRRPEAGGALSGGGHRVLSYLTGPDEWNFFHGVRPKYLYICLRHTSAQLYWRTVFFSACYKILPNLRITRTRTRWAVKGLALWFYIEHSTNESYCNNLTCSNKIVASPCLAHVYAIAEPSIPAPITHTSNVSIADEIFTATSAHWPLSYYEDVLYDWAGEPMKTAIQVDTVIYIIELQCFFLRRF